MSEEPIISHLAPELISLIAKALLGSIALDGPFDPSRLRALLHLTVINKVRSRSSTQRKLIGLAALARKHSA